MPSAAGVRAGPRATPSLSRRLGARPAASRAPSLSPHSAHVATRDAPRRWRRSPAAHRHCSPATSSVQASRGKRLPRSARAAVLAPQCSPRRAHPAVLASPCLPRRARLALLAPPCSPRLAYPPCSPSGASPFSGATSSTHVASARSSPPYSRGASPFSRDLPRACPVRAPVSPFLTPWRHARFQCAHARAITRTPRLRASPAGFIREASPHDVDDSCLVHGLLRLVPVHPRCPGAVNARSARGALLPPCWTQRLSVRTGMQQRSLSERLSRPSHAAPRPFDRGTAPRSSRTVLLPP